MRSRLFGVVWAMLSFGACESTPAGAATDVSNALGFDVVESAETISDAGAVEPEDAVDATDAEADSETEEADAASLEAPPVEEATLLTWLAGGGYLDWDAEAATHDSAGPHFGLVRTFANGGAALKSGAQFPVGTAFVKELYGKSAGEVLGWSVMVRTTDDAGGSGWWWYERYGDSVYAASQGAGLCTGCHAAGQDFVLTPYPF
jgi:hypothetical protein